MSGSGVRITRGDGFRSFGERADRAAQAAVADIVATGHAHVIEQYKSGRTEDGQTGRTDTGQTWKAVRALPPVRTQRGWRASLVVQPPQDKVAVIVEHGRRPGHPVSEEGQRRIRTWVARKLRNRVLSGARGARVTKANASKGRVTGVSTADAEKAFDRAAFLIARKIQRKGIAALRPFRRAADALRGGKARDIYQRALRRTRVAR